MSLAVPLLIIKSYRIDLELLMNMYCFILD
uniref:Uncharacterized protein n=1 Tax=Anguilla anguilla TaxID=7936 RepID=A0A0E9TEV6_ANGAN